MTASFLCPIAAGLLTQESVSIVFFSLQFFLDDPLKRQVYQQRNNDNVMFQTAIPRRVEERVCGHSGCVLHHIYRLSGIRYGGHTSVELSRSKISSIYSRRLSALERISPREEQDRSKPNESHGTSVMYFFFDTLYGTGYDLHKKLVLYLSTVVIPCVEPSALLAQK